MPETAIRSNDRHVIESAWRDQAMWSETANLFKTSLFTWRYRATLAGVAGALFQTLAATLVSFGDAWWWPRTVISIVGTVILATVPFITKNKASKDHLARWVRARSASEALKEVIYRFLVGVPPFETNSSVAALSERCQAIKEKVQDLRIYNATVEPQPKKRPFELTVDEYVENRVNDQIDNFYVPKAREKALKAERLHGWEFRFGGLAVVLAALASALPAAGLTQLSVLGSWVAVVTTIVAAITAHLASSRYDHEAIIYLGTADRLTAVRDIWLSDPNRMAPASVTRFVENCEHAISTQNEAWLAKWTRNQPKASVNG